MTHEGGRGDCIKQARERQPPAGEIVGDPSHWEMKHCTFLKSYRIVTVLLSCRLPK